MYFVVQVKSIKKSEFGCRCPAYELTALESRAAYYWEKVKFMLEKLHRLEDACFILIITSAPSLFKFTLFESFTRQFHYLKANSEQGRFDPQTSLL